MAESANQAPTPAAVIPPPVESAPAQPKVTRRESKFMKAMSKLMTTTAWMGFAVGFILLGIFNHYHELVPAAAKAPFALLLPHLSYFLVGLGLGCIAKIRNGVQDDYSAEYKKNRQFSHAWKIPLIVVEVLIYVVLGIYGVLVGVGKVEAVQNISALLSLFILFLLYLLWYAIAFIMNRSPARAGFLVAGYLGLAPAFISICFWVSQFIFLSLVFAVLALIATIVGLTISSTPGQEQRLNGMRILCAAGTLGLLLIVGLNASSYGNSRAVLAGLGLASKNPMGNIGVIAYSPEDLKVLNNPQTANRQKLAFSIHTQEGWFLQVIEAREKEFITSYKVPAGEGPFRPVFAEGGKSIILDPVKGGERGLWKVDAATGRVEVLRRGGVRDFGDGTPWSETTKQFLYVTGDDSGYQLNVYPAGKSKKALLTSASPILSPSWTMSGDLISYADGTHGVFRVLNLKTGKSEALLSDQEKAENQKMEGIAVKEVIPAPDGFRYLYLAEEGKESSLWLVLADGTKREKIYESRGELSNIAWNPDAQKVLFEEKRSRSVFLNLFYPYGFLTESRRIRILDANLNTAEDLIFPQISHRAPAVSPDGVKVAFVADQGLWLRRGSPAIWVAHLR